MVYFIHDQFLNLETEGIGKFFFTVFFLEQQ